MVYVYCLIFFSYSVALLLLKRSWRSVLANTRTSVPAIPKKLPSVTVIIPVRNEAEHILHLLADLQRQTHTDFEVLVVDDHSTDGTPALVNDFIKRCNKGRLLVNPSNGKKAAITAGVESAAGSIIICTDGDCRVGTSWVAKAAEVFADASVHFAFGVVRVAASSFFQRLQAIEFASVIGTGVAAHGLGHTLYCNGANLAFRKSTFVEVDGYEGNLHVASGDDEFLMRKIMAQFPNGTKIFYSEDSVVSTTPATDVATFFNQRLRWAGKWRFAPVKTKLAAVGTVLIHAIFLSSWVAILMGVTPVLLVSLWLLKMVMEWSFLSSVCTSTRVRFDVKSFLVLQFAYSFYVVTIGILSNFLSYRWKERTLPAAVRQV
jgi:cellulose synthase/poly-beta-1,6-N-acetylglucosamine synthase-like glycosyltransferase